MTGTVICPHCDASVDVTVTLLAVGIEVDGQPSMTVVASPVYSHICVVTG